MLNGMASSAETVKARTVSLMVELENSPTSRNGSRNSSSSFNGNTMQVGELGTTRNEQKIFGSEISKGSYKI